MHPFQAVDIRRLRGVRRTLSPPHLQDLLLKCSHKKRFGEHACALHQQRLIHPLCIVVCQEQQRHCFRQHLPQFFYRGEPLCLDNVPVDQEQLTARLCLALQHAHRLFCRQSDVRHDAGIPHQHPDVLADRLLPVHCQDPRDPAVLPEFPVRVPLRYAQLQLDAKYRTFVHLARHIDRPAHQLHDILGDRHAKPCSLHLVRRAVLRPCKRVKQHFEILRRHAVPVILHLDPDPLKLGAALFPADDAEPDIPALLCVLHRVGEQVDQDLVDPRLIPEEILVLYVRDFHMKPLLPRRCHRSDDGIHGGHQIIQRKLLDREHDLPALDLRDIEDIVDQAEQMLPGCHDLLCVLPHFFRIFRVPGKQRRESDHCVHRRADIVGHI